MNGVKQDSESLRQDATYISDMADEFKVKYEQLFEVMGRNLSADANENIAWWGPQAKAFLNQFNTKEDTFKQAYLNICNMADNLVQQADAWDTFEDA